MLSVNDRKWASFKFSDLFEMHNGYFHVHPKNDINGTIPRYAASDSNNGIKGYVTIENIKASERNGHRINNVTLETKFDTAPAICVTNNGSIGHAYYADTDFIASDDISILKTKDVELTEKLAMFLITCIEKQGALFHYARKWKLVRMINSRVLLPIDANGKPDYAFMSDYIGERLTQKAQEKKDFIKDALPQYTVFNVPALQDKKWQAFSFDELFEMHNGYFHMQPKSQTNGTIPCLSSTDSNNGITGMLTEDRILHSSKSGHDYSDTFDKKLEFGPAIAVNNGGSIGHSYYVTGKFVARDATSIYHLKNQELTENIALFLIPNIEKQGHLFSYARPWSLSRMRISHLILPVDNNNNPDWQYMNDYIENQKQSLRNVF